MSERESSGPGDGVGARTIGIRDVARHAGVSTATVSRALNRPERVSPDLRARIIRTIEEIGYIPDALARALTSRRTRTVGAIVPTVDNAMFAQGLQALQSYLATQDYLLLLATNEYDLEIELKQARNLIERGVDALILRGDRRHPHLRRLLDGKAMPFVNVGLHEPQKPYASVGVDNAEAGRCLAGYVTGLGHRKVAMVSAIAANNDRAQARQAGILDVLGRLGCAPPPEWRLEVAYRLDDARDAARALLRGGSGPTAVLCGNDVIAGGVMLEAIRLGVAVPRDLSVAGFDDIDLSRHLNPSLTTIHIPTDEIWVRAGRYLVDRLNGDAAESHQKMAFALKARGSTAPPRA